MRLTAAGEALVGPARRTLASAAQAEQAVHRTRDVLVRTLRLGVSLLRSASGAVRFLSRRVHSRSSRRRPAPAVRARVDDDLDGRGGELDCVIGPAVSQVPGVRMTRLAGEPLHLACRGDHRLAGRAAVSIRELTGSGPSRCPKGGRPAC